MIQTFCGVFCAVVAVVALKKNPMGGQICPTPGEKKKGVVLPIGSGLLADPQKKPLAEYYGTQKKGLMFPLRNVRLASKKTAECYQLVTGWQLIAQKKLNGVAHAH